MIQVLVASSPTHLRTLSYVAPVPRIAPGLFSYELDACGTTPSIGFF